MTSDELPTLVFPTMARPACAEALIVSARKRFPRMPIIMVEQVDGASPLQGLCGRHHVRHITLPFDAGVSASRNRGVELVETEYFVLADDDMFLLDDTEIDRVLAFMAAYPEIGFVGGELEERRPELNARKIFATPRARNLAFDTTGRGLIVMPAEVLRANVMLHDGARFQVCDLVPNWGIGRTHAFNSAPLRWDERFKNNGDHYDFFLNWKLNHPQWKVAYSENLKCAHNPLRPEPYRSLRYRSGWGPLFAEKWGVDYVFNVGGNIRWLVDFDNSFERMPDFRGEAVIDWKQRYVALREKHQQLQALHAAAKARADSASGSRARPIAAAAARAADPPRDPDGEGEGDLDLLEG